MKKEYYKLFKKSMKKEYSNNKNIIDIIEDANKIDEYGELRVALENILENDIKLSTNMIDIADKAFGNNKSDYDKQLIDALRNI